MGQHQIGRRRGRAQRGGPAASIGTGRAQNDVVPGGPERGEQRPEIFRWEAVIVGDDEVQGKSGYGGGSGPEGAGVADPPGRGAAGAKRMLMAGDWQVR